MRHNSARDRRRNGRGTTAVRNRWRLRPTLLVLEDRRLLSTWTVNSTGDTGSGSGLVGDLRYCITGANSAGGDQTIGFDSTVFGTPQTITLSGTQLELSDTTGTETITGPAAGVAVSGNNASRVFRIDSGVTASISGLTVTGGRATGSGNARDGGGLYNVGGTLSLTDCTVSGNTAAFRGGGLYNFAGGTLTLTNCTVSGNTASTNSGGGLRNASTATLTNCTVSANSAPDSVGGGLRNSGTMMLNNTIVAGNSAAGSPDLNGAFSGTNNLIGGDPLLAPLGNYGGPTQTMALLPGSPAIDAGNNALIPSGVTTDQRGVPRIVDGTVDIGAFESSGFTIAATSGSGQTAGAVFAAPLVATVTAKNSLEPVAGGLVTFTPPASGASAFINGSPAVISGSGTASVTAANNGFAGTYIVSATASGAPVAASFSLTNLPVVSIAVSPGNPDLALGVTGQFSATVTFSDGSTADFTGLVIWASATPSVAAIGATGAASALAVGQSAITASLAGVTSPDDTLTVMAPSFVVNTTDDAFGFYTGTTSLREAIAGADVVPGQTITFDSSVFGTPQTIGLTGGPLELSDTIGTTTITGPAAGVTVNGGGLSGVFQVDPNVAASISGLTITGGNANYGGGLANYGGYLTLTNCTVSGNYAYSGGGLWSDGTATLTNTTVSGNSASGFDGGGALWNAGTAALTNCTVSGNSGIYVGGLYLTYGSSTTTLTNTIVAGDSGYNEIGFGAYSGTNNLIGGDPLLAPLGNYGGPTQTMALLPGSPAIGMGTAVSGITTDQRGEPLDSPPDIGAFQSQGFTLTPVPGSTPQSSQIGSPFADPLAVTVTANNPVEPVDGGVVNFASTVNQGALAILSAPSAVIAGGQAAITAAPNNAVGSYTVVASAAGAAPVSFALTNVGPVYTSLVVNTTSGSLFPGSGFLSLPEAVAFANFDSSGTSTITFDPAVFATPQTITLNGTQLELFNATETETITGPAVGVTVNGGGLSRVFQVDANVTASISGLTISGGSANNGGGLANYGGNLTLTNCAVSGNYASGSGGGLYSAGTTTLTGSTISGNYAYGNGGGFNNYGMATLTGCTVSGNSTNRGDGGGVHNYGTITLNNCLVSDNATTYSGYSSAGRGGGLYNGGTATLTDCIVSGNSTSASRGDGAGVCNGQAYSGHGETTTLTDCTVSGNVAFGDSANGGGLYNAGGGYSNPVAGTIILTDCVISGNSASYYGGGLSNFGSVTATGCTISGNSASNGLGCGGGVSNGGTFNAYTAIATLTNCIIDDNSATGYFGSGGGVASWGAATMTNCTVSGNTAAGAGGGVYSAASANGGSPPGRLTLTACTVDGNSANTGGGVLTAGGAIAFYSGGEWHVQTNAATTILTNCTVSGNSATVYGGGIDTSRVATTTATGTTVSGNTAANGGGVQTGGSYFFKNLYGATVLTNCTVSGNSATGNGGGLGNTTLGSTTLTGTSVTDNSAVAGGGIFSQGPLTVAASKISNNTAIGGAGAAGIGGGILSDGGGLALQQQHADRQHGHRRRRGQRQRRRRWHRRRPRPREQRDRDRHQVLFRGQHGHGGCRRRGRQRRRRHRWRHRRGHRQCLWDVGHVVAVTQRRLLGR